MELTNEENFLRLLRAELTTAMAQLELRLVDRYASKKEIEAELAQIREQAAEDRAASAVQFASIGSALQSLVGWRNRLLGALALVTFLMPVLATVSWHLWG